MLLLILLFYFVQCSDFIDFSVLKLPYNNDCKIEEFLIQEAAIEEYKPENKNKVIIYHGQTYGALILQLLMKEWLFPEATDWLPLRLPDAQYHNANRKDLLSLVESIMKDDHQPSYRNFGLSASINLVSSYKAESAWSFICQSPYRDWDMISGASGHHDSLLSELVHSFVSERQKKIVDLRIKAILYYIQKKRNLPPSPHLPAFKPEHFAKIFSRIDADWKQELFEEKEYEKPKAEGVALQIIMDKELSNELCYPSFPYGYIYSSKNDKYRLYNSKYEGEPIEYFTEYYHENKNTHDFLQIRLALNRDFREFPSRVRIKVISGLQENQKDYDLLLEMIRHVKTRTSLDRISI